MTIKPIRWVGAAREEIQSLPEDARKEVGFALWTLQQGIKSSDFKPMSIVVKVLNKFGFGQKMPVGYSILLDLKKLFTFSMPSVKKLRKQ
jgi:hypothetical protein